MSKQSGFLFILLLTGPIVDSNKLNDTKGLSNPNVHDLVKQTERNKRSFESDEDNPFWGNRGRRHLDQDSLRRLSRMGDDNIKESFSRLEDLFKNDMSRMFPKELNEEASPYWASRGRRSVFDRLYALRALNYKDPSDKNRSLRKISLPEINDEGDIFWGNRGRRQENEKNDPFWGNRGRRFDSSDIDGPFWGNRGKRAYLRFWVNRGRRQIDQLPSDMATLEDDLGIDSFWANRGRNSQLKQIFNQKNHLKLPEDTHSRSFTKNSVLIPEQPDFILVDRSSRSSSSEDDPFYISRGKKLKNEFKSQRGRRGIYEQIAKSVNIDPYYIARGKKNDADEEVAQVSQKEFDNMKELLCLPSDTMKTDERYKRSDDRDRRTILNDLAARLKTDPYFASRGKKAKSQDMDKLISKLTATMCQ